MSQINKLTARSLKRLKGVHPDLVKVINRAAEISEQPFQVTEGVRSLARQRELVRRGASKTLRSRHLTGHAVDLVAMVSGEVSWKVPLYYVIARAVKQAAKELGIPVQWGGDWSSFFDGPHFQLPHAQYPAIGVKATDRAEALAARVLSIGDSGAAVLKLQKGLIQLGFILVADGQFGPKTFQVVAIFQSANKLRADGVVGPKTRAKLREALKIQKKEG